MIDFWFVRRDWEDLRELNVYSWRRGGIIESVWGKCLRKIVEGLFRVERGWRWRNWLGARIGREMIRRKFYRGAGGRREGWIGGRMGNDLFIEYKFF